MKKALHFVVAIAAFIYKPWVEQPRDGERQTNRAAQAIIPKALLEIARASRIL